jgi:DNA recombination protein RmuC
MEFLFLAAGALTGVALGWFIAKASGSQQQQVQAGLLVAEKERTRSLEQRVQELTRSLEADREKVLDLTNNLAATEANYRNLEEKLSERGRELGEMQTRFADQFKNLANDILEEKTKKFTEQNRTSLFDILKPLGDKITEFEKRVDASHKDTRIDNAALKEQLVNLQRLNLQMTREAENLTRALKGDTQAQGAWGEFILESILEKSGLERDREYTVQESFNTTDGRLRPDIIVRLPGNKHVIIDSKVSLTAYTSFVNAGSDEEKSAALKAHLISIRQHIKLLSEKNYQKLTESGLEFIILFIPIEPAYIVAIQNERSLYEEALDRRIVFVSPTLLIPSLQMIKNIWKQENQQRHVLDIATKAGDLYDKFVGFSEDLIKLGQYMDTSKKFYEESMKKLSEGSGNLVRRVEELKKLGARANKNIDPKLLSRSENQIDLLEN